MIHDTRAIRLTRYYVHELDTCVKIHLSYGKYARLFGRICLLQFNAVNYNSMRKEIKKKNSFHLWTARMLHGNSVIVASIAIISSVMMMMMMVSSVTCGCKMNEFFSLIWFWKWIQCMNSQLTISVIRIATVWIRASVIVITAINTIWWTKSYSYSPKTIYSNFNTS